MVFFLPIIVLKPDFEYGHWFLYSRLFILDGDFELADTYHNYSNVYIFISLDRSLRMSAEATMVRLHSKSTPYTRQ